MRSTRQGWMRIPLPSLDELHNPQKVCLCVIGWGAGGGGGWRL